MAHSTVILDKRSAKKDGTFPIKIRITHIGEFYISTGIDVFENQWQEISTQKSKSGSVINHPLAPRYNNRISAIKLDIDRQLIDLEDRSQITKMTNARLREQLKKSTSGKPTAYLFKEHYDKYAAGITRASTLDTLRNTYVNIAKFCNIDTLSFSDMNYEWLKEFDKFMETPKMTSTGRETKLSINGRAVYMRNIRAIFNDAIKCDYVSLLDYPFRKFTIKTEKTRKRSLTVEQLRALRDYECQKHQRKYRDIFMLIFYLHGINLIDLLNLKEINNGRIEFSRAKTGRLYSIKVEPEAFKIIESYRGKDYLLDILDRYSDHKDFMRRMNRGLQKIGILEWVDNVTKTRKNKKKITAEFPDITSYWARHTVATLATKIKIPKDTIAAMLGHAQNTVTDVYIDYDLSLIDEANRKLLDFVKGNEI